MVVSHDGQHIDGIVTDGDNLNAGSLDLLQVALQLDQLLLAKGSPTRRAEKDQGDVAFLQKLIQGNRQ